jgi:ubiquinone/menaquinone biosynthesis C-methylase UbiE
METSGQNKVIERDFWDKEANKEKYLAYEKGVYCSFREIEYDEIFSEVLNKGKGGRALDIGCAGGVSSCLLAKKGFNVEAFDISHNLVKQAKIYSDREKIPLHFFVADAEKMPLKDKSYDVCFLSGVLHHFPNYGPILDEINRILKPNGKLVAVEPNILNIFYRLSFMLSKARGEVSPNECPISPIKLRNFLEKYFCNFEIRPYRNDIPLLRQIGLKRNKLSYKVLEGGMTGILKFLTPKISQGTFFIFSCEKI